MGVDFRSCILFIPLLEQWEFVYGFYCGVAGK